MSVTILAIFSCIKTAAVSLIILLLSFKCLSKYITLVFINCRCLIGELTFISLARLSELFLIMSLFLLCNGYSMSPPKVIMIIKVEYDVIYQASMLIEEGLGEMFPEWRWNIMYKLDQSIECLGCM